MVAYTRSRLEALQHDTEILARRASSSCLLNRSAWVRQREEGSEWVAANGVGLGGGVRGWVEMMLCSRCTHTHTHTHTHTTHTHTHTPHTHTHTHLVDDDVDGHGKAGHAREELDAVAAIVLGPVFAHYVPHNVKERRLVDRRLQTLRDRHRVRVCICVCL
jgi:ABC-type nickel/cobalt efflux system permease component RcnA